MIKWVQKPLNKHALSNCSVCWIGAGRMGYTDVALGTDAVVKLIS